MLRAAEARHEHAGDPVPIDRVSMSYQDRYLRRRTVDGVDGEAILIDLPSACSLNDGDRLVLEDGRHIEVTAAVEDLLEVRAADPAVLARLAWHIGNRHTPCQVEAGRLLIQRDHVLEDMLGKLGAQTAHVTEPFRPEGGAYGHGRTHAHSHSHNPHEDPNAHIPHRHE
ncbi:MAG: urease accessory protein UreE [Pseudomonadota bacterium]